MAQVHVFGGNTQNQIEVLKSLKELKNQQKNFR